MSSPHSKQVIVGTFGSEGSTELRLTGQFDAASAELLALPSQANEYSLAISDSEHSASEAPVSIKILVTEDALHEGLHN